MEDKKFVIKLIESLKYNQIYNKGITIPYLLGAYKIKGRDESPITIEYIRQTFEQILLHSDRQFFISSCTNVDNHYIISLMTGEDDDDIRDGVQYKHIDNMNGIPVIYFEEFFECPKLTLENVCNLFWEKYKDILLQKRYSYTNIGWVEFDSNSEEYKIIRNI